MHPRPTRTFVSLTGPAGNIGDALLRRATLGWAGGTSDELVAYVGDAPDVWLRQLGIPSDAIVLRSKRSILRWLWMLATSPAHPVLIFEAGEIPLHKGNGLRELVFLLETWIVRAKRGVVVRPPRGIRGTSTPSLRLHSLAARGSQFALWRDRRSADAVGTGRVVPDLGFAAGQRDGAPFAERRELIVSLRGTRPHPGQAWITAVRPYAAESALRNRTVVQVREDETRSEQLATELGGVFEPWADHDAVEHEAVLRTRYDGAQLVLSDRMHVLVLAALSGAVPAELVPDPTDKIAENFAVVGITGTTMDAASATPADMTAFLTGRLADAELVRRRVADAAAVLAGLEAEVHTAIRTART